MFSYLVAVQTPVLVKGRGRVFVNPVKIHDLTYSTSTGGKEAEFKQERHPPLDILACQAFFSVRWHNSDG
jgi:hypothetical protein